MAPGARIDFRWDDLGAFPPHPRENPRTVGHVTITTRYADLTGNRYEHDWVIDPAAYGGAQQHRGIDELVAAVENL